VIVSYARLVIPDLIATKRKRATKEQQLDDHLAKPRPFNPGDSTPKDKLTGSGAIADDPCIERSSGPVESSTALGSPRSFLS